MRDITRRLYDYIELIVLPRVASQLGSGWEADGLALSTPDGRDFALCVDLGLRPSDPPKLLVRQPLQPDVPFVQTPFVEVMATATPERIAHALLEGLCSQSGDGSGFAEVAGSTAKSSPDSDPGPP